MRERARRECGCDKALDAARKALAAATATTFPGLHALARYAVELREQEDELYSAEECASWYLLPAIERSLAGVAAEREQV